MGAIRMAKHVITKLHVLIPVFLATEVWKKKTDCRNRNLATVQFICALTSGQLYPYLSLLKAMHCSLPW